MESASERHRNASRLPGSRRLHRLPPLLLRPSRHVCPSRAGCRSRSAAIGRAISGTFSTYSSNAELGLRLLPRATHVRLEGIGHELHGRHAQRVLDAIDPFLETV